MPGTRNQPDYGIYIEESQEQIDQDASKRLNFPTQAIS
jgi:hypothetical protein